MQHTSRLVQHVYTMWTTNYYHGKQSTIAFFVGLEAYIFLLCDYNTTNRNRITRN
jgi:hypothetical protein